MLFLDGMLSMYIVLFCALFKPGFSPSSPIQTFLSLLFSCYKGTRGQLCVWFSHHTYTLLCENWCYLPVCFSVVILQVLVCTGTKFVSGSSHLKAK